MRFSQRFFAFSFYLFFVLSGSYASAKDCIGVVPAGGGYSFWGEVGRGAKKAGEELGVEIYYRGPADENNPNSQKEVLGIIEQMHCKALVLAPNVPERNQDVAKFKANKIPTVYIDREFGNSEAIAVIATDNYHAGELAGQQMARALNNKGTVAVFHMKKGVQSTDDRERGFIAAAKAAGLTIAIEEWIGNNVGEARDKSLKVLRALKTPVNGIFTPNESTTLATLATIKTLGIGSGTKLIGFDMSADYISSFQNNELYGVVVQRPYQMGYQGVKIAFNAVSGKMPEKHNIDPGTFFVTQATLRSPEYAQDLAPFLNAKKP